MTMSDPNRMVNENGDAAVWRDQDKMEIDLVGLLTRIVDKWYMVILFALIGTIISCIYTFQFVTPLYQATSKLYVVNSRNSVINLSDFQIGNYLAKDYTEVFTNWHVHERVIEELNLPYSYSQLNRMISVRNMPETRILYITATSTDPKEAMEMADMYAKVACEFISVKMEQETPSEFESARLPASPSSPNVIRNILLGFALGAFLAIAIITIGFISDDRVRTPEEVNKLVGIPTLGVVTEQSEFRHGSRKTSRRRQRGGLTL